MMNPMEFELPFANIPIKKKKLKVSEDTNVPAYSHNKNQNEKTQKNKKSTKIFYLKNAEEYSLKPVIGHHKTCNALFTTLGPSNTQICFLKKLFNALDFTKIFMDEDKGRTYPMLKSHHLQYDITLAYC